MDSRNKFNLALEQARGTHSSTSGQRADQSLALSEAATFRLDALKLEMDHILSQNHDVRRMFDLAIVAGDQPNLWIDSITSVVMEPDNHTLRLVQEHNGRREILAETRHREAMVDHLTRYLAHRMVEIERTGKNTNLQGKQIGNARHYQARYVQSADHVVSTPKSQHVERVQHETFVDDDARQSGLHYNRMRQLNASVVSPDRVLVQTHITQQSQFQPKLATAQTGQYSETVVQDSSFNPANSYNPTRATMAPQVLPQQSSVDSFGHSQTYVQNSSTWADKLKQPLSYTLGQSIYIWLTGMGFGAAGLWALALALGKW